MPRWGGAARVAEGVKLLRIFSGSSPVPTPARGARARGEERRRFQREWNEEDVGLLIEATGGAGKVCASRIPEVGISSPWKETSCCDVREREVGDDLVGPSLESA